MNSKEIKEIIRKKIIKVLNETGADATKPEAYVAFDSIIRQLEEIEEITKGHVSKLSIDSAISMLVTERDKIEPEASRLVPDDAGAEGIPSIARGVAE